MTISFDFSIKDQVVLIVARYDGEYKAMSDSSSQRENDNKL